MVKVLIVAGTMNVGGIENQLMHLIRNADRSQFQIDYTTTVEHPYYQDEIESLGGKCIQIDNTNGGKNIIKYCRELLKVLKNGKYDVIHSNELFHSGIVLWMAKIAGVKCRIAHAHSCNQTYGNKKIRKIYHWIMRKMILSYATDLIACSSFAAEFLYGPNFQKDQRYHLIVNSVETKRFLQELPENEHNEFYREGWRNIIQIGRFADEKNFLFTVEIAKEIKSRGLKVRFLFVGNNGEDYETRVRNKVDKFDLNEYIIFLGVRKNVDLLLKKSDCFILPSKYEGMPLTLIEAQASCLPCVVADTFSHEVDFGINNVQWVQLEDNVEVWVNAILRAIQNGKSEKKAVIEAIEKKGFDSQIFTGSLCKLYRSRLDED